MNKLHTLSQKPDKKGFTGLSNIGNTCFLNSVIQVLVHTPEIIQILDTVPAISLASTANINHLLAFECKQLIKLMWEKNQTISPNRFVQVVQIVSTKKGNPIFEGFSQNDVSEFLLFLIECIHETLSKPSRVTISGTVVNEVDEIAKKCYESIRNIYTKGYSPIYSKFYGMCFTEILSKEEPSKVLSIKCEHYFMIDLPLPPPEVKSPTIYDCLDNYVAKELMEGNNAWYNETTKQKQDVYKKISFWNFPPVLVINLKRYKDLVRKDHRIVEFPVDCELVLTRYSLSYGSFKYRYRLYATCNHHGGSIMGGHYTSCVSPADSPGEWFHFNDTMVIPIEPLMLISPQTSCLFYRRCE